MRATDMQVGRLYALESDRPTGPAKVKLLATEHPRPGRVLVQFLEGIPKGRQVEVPSRRVLHEWGKEKPKPRPRRPRKPQPPPLAVGVSVVWAETGPIPWKVTKLHHDRGIATLKGKIFGTDQEREAPISELETLSDEPDPEGDRKAREAVKAAVGETEEPKRATEEAARRKEAVEPQLPDDAKRRLIEQLVFSPELLERYRRRFAPKNPGRPLAEHRP